MGPDPKRGQANSGCRPDPERGQANSGSVSERGQVNSGRPPDPAWGQANSRCPLRFRVGPGKFRFGSESGSGKFRLPARSRRGARQILAAPTLPGGARQIPVRVRIGVRRIRVEAGLRGGFPAPLARLRTPRGGVRRGGRRGARQIPVWVRIGVRQIPTARQIRRGARQVRLAGGSGPGSRRPGRSGQERGRFRLRGCFLAMLAKNREWSWSVCRPGRGPG